MQEEILTVICRGMRTTNVVPTYLNRLYLGK